jgi:YtxH-like protein
MRLRKESILWNVMLGTGVYLLDSLRNRLVDGVDDLSDRARETYGEASRRVSRASGVIRGEEESHGVRTAIALLAGVGVGLGVGLLLAPASGEETRNTISNKVQDFGDRVRDKFTAESTRQSGTGTYGA